MNRKEKMEKREKEKEKRKYFKNITNIENNYTKIVTLRKVEKSNGSYNHRNVERIAIYPFY